ncbi:hypothetical protein L7F22_008663 [Adiantum nelumboides]|nr:hypothetical protein [Adiantum nelumboides]
MVATRNKQLNDEILNSMIGLHSICDKYRTPIQMQDELLRAWFGGLGPSKGRQSLCEKPMKSLASLLIQKPSDWDGSLNGRSVPCKWPHMVELYKEMGMVPLQEWKLCLGEEDHIHSPHIMKPSLEDDREVQEALKCRRRTSELPRPLRRDCDKCCERCPICNRRRKDVMPFHFISLIGQLKLLCKSEAICWDFLRMWRARDRWLDKTVNEQPEFIDEFWDVEKTRMYQNFWNPQKEWEPPILCSNPNCRRAHRAFPPELIGILLHKGLNLRRQDAYDFRCSKCATALEAQRTWIKGDPRNLALLLHWDGFQAASTTQKDSAVVEVVVLNGGKKSIVGSIPVLFLPFSHRDLLKKNGDVLSSFLFPLISELESSFIDGFEVDYGVPCEKICDGLQGETPRVRCMLMICTGDHPAQCKLGQFKDGGMAFCRRDKAKAELRRDSNVTHYVYNNNRFQGRYPPEKRHVDDMWESITKAKRCSVKVEAEELLRDAGLAGIHAQDIEIGMLLVDIAHMFFDCSRKIGWSKDCIAKCRSLLLSWRIRSEEYYGANSSPLEHVAGNGEILDDVIRHGSHDVTWCFSHERNVSGYLSINTNNRSNELSYSRESTALYF